MRRFRYSLMPFLGLTLIFNCATARIALADIMNCQLYPDACAAYEKAHANGVCGSANGLTLSQAPSTSCVNGNTGMTCSLCMMGTASAVSGNGPWTWTCGGSNNGAVVQCSAQSSANTTAVNGACGLVNGTKVSSAPISNLCSTGTASTVSSSAPWTWTCAGSNGGTDASCSTQSSATTKGVNGACGSANGVAVSSKPTSNLCGTSTSADTSSASSDLVGRIKTRNRHKSNTTPVVSGTGPWMWTCPGSNGGTAASCSAPLLSATTNSTDGACGSANGIGASSPPTLNLCSSGTASSVIPGSWTPPCSGTNVACSMVAMLAYTWSCAGSDGGATAQCHAPETAPIVGSINGVCGSADGTGSSSAPTSNLCRTGAASAVIGDGPWLWVCAGTDGGKDADCKAPLQSASAVCGSSAGTCQMGAPGNVANADGAMTWTCTGSDGSTAQCSVQPTVINGACGSANGTFVSSAPTSNLCSTGTASFVCHGSYTWYRWMCSGSNGGTSAQCNATAINGCSVCGASGTCQWGTPSNIVTNGGVPESWTCQGANGQTVTCPSACANWNMDCNLSSGSALNAP
jgi:hypothetical protein